MQNHILNNKRVLFFYLSTFNYEVEIQKAMEREGALVDSFNERPSNNLFVHIMVRINRNLIDKMIVKYYKDIIKRTRDNKYDYIFFIKGESISPAIINELRAAHPEAQIVMYYWDSIANNRNSKSMLGSFDKVLTFDKNDSQELGMDFLPLFYIPQYAEIAKKHVATEYDLMFAGTTHSDRYQFVTGIANQIKLAGGKCFLWFYFPSIILYYKMKLENPEFRKANKKEFSFKPMPREKLLDYYTKARIQIDIQHPKQIGLTMRTIETLGAKKKLITTNKDIVNYDFYRPENILVVDRSNPKITKEFIETDWTDIPDNIYNKYSISSWLNTIFS